MRCWHVGLWHAATVRLCVSCRSSPALILMDADSRVADDFGHREHFIASRLSRPYLVTFRTFKFARMLCWYRRHIADRAVLNADSCESTTPVEGSHLVVAADGLHPDVPFFFVHLDAYIITHHCFAFGPAVVRADFPFSPLCQSLFLVHNFLLIYRSLTKRRT